MKMLFNAFALGLFFFNAEAQIETPPLPKAEREEILEAQKPDDPQIVEDLPGIQKEEEAPKRAPPTSYINEFDNPALDNGNGTTTNRRHEKQEL